MYCLANAEMADMHFVYGLATGNARLATKLYKERYSNRDVSDHRLFTRLRQSLSENGSFCVPNANAGRAGDLDLHHEEDVLEHFQVFNKTHVRALVL